MNIPEHIKKQIEEKYQHATEKGLLGAMLIKAAEYGYSLAPQSNAGVSEEEIKRLAEEILFKDYGINAKNFTYSPFKDFLAAMVEMYQSASKPKDNELLEALKEVARVSSPDYVAPFKVQLSTIQKIAKEAIAKP